MAGQHIDPSNINSLWCGVLAETLHLCGLREVVLSPGSRSTPLTFAFVGHPGFSCTPVLDERSAGFFALGLAKRSARPVVLVCTSGTAAANYLPAVVEAREAGVPLLVLTADRPPEMRACSSGQTIDQQKLFGSFVSFFHEVAVPEARVPLLRYLRQLVSQAVERSLSPFPGPVHLNCPFRDPLVPSEGESCAHLLATLRDDAFWAHLSPPVPDLQDHGELPDFVPGRGVVVAGPMPEGCDPASHARSVCAAARALGWPVLADTLSQLRQHPHPCPALVTHYDAVLRSPALCARLAPAQVLLVGAMPTSKALRAWLEGLGSSGVPLFSLNRHVESRDPLHAPARTLRRTAASLASALGGSAYQDIGYAGAWAAASRAAAACIEAALQPAPPLLSEPRAAWLLPGLLPRGTPLMVANSMPVRDLEYLWAEAATCHRVYFNRGANGIDGTVSTAFGLAQDGPPCVLLTGDLSLLHDSNGLLLHRRLRGSLTVLLVNNDGGGIFEHLAVARHQPPFEEYFATPQGVDFSRLAAAHGIAHHRISGWEDFAANLSRLPERGVRVLELRTDRKADAAGRKALFASAAQAAEAALA